MTIRSLILISTLALLTGGCSCFKKSKLVKVNTKQHSPVRLQVYDWPDIARKAEPANLKQILILPPLGIGEAGIQRSFHQQLYGAAQRHFNTPLKVVLADSAYAPYVSESNLVRNDGTINIEEIAFIGALMNSTHVLCPYVRELRPYHPQRLDIRLVLINSGTSTVCAELSSVFDARKSDVVDYFMKYSKIHKGHDESTNDLRIKIKSPDAFQAFVADICSTVMAQQLSL